MIRNLKMMGLALVAILALGALVASTAFAATPGLLTTEKGNSVTLNGVEDGANFLEDPGLGEKVECKGSTITGHKVNVTPHAFIPNKSSSATITPTFNNETCHSGTHKATVHVNGCDFDLNIGETTVSPAGQYAADVDITCPTGQVIDVEVFLGSASEAVKICTYEIGPQTITGFDATNDSPAEAITAVGTGNVIAHRTGACGEKVNYTTKQTISFTVTGKNEAGAAEGVTLSD